MIKDSGREKLSDKKFDSPVSEEKFINKLFERLVAKKVVFKSLAHSVLMTKVINLAPSSARMSQNMKIKVTI